MSNDNDTPTRRRFMGLTAKEQIADILARGLTPRRVRDDAAAEFGQYTARYAFEITSALGHLLNALDEVYEAAGVCAQLAEDFSNRAMAASEPLPVPPTLKQ